MQIYWGLIVNILASVVCKWKEGKQKAMAWRVVRVTEDRIMRVFACASISSSLHSTYTCRKRLRTIVWRSRNVWDNVARITKKSVWSSSYMWIQSSACRLKSHKHAWFNGEDVVVSLDVMACVDSSSATHPRKYGLGVSCVTQLQSGLAFAA